ncbi:MAG: hypothetical protein Q4G49_07870 [Paracoccus sp. (in: a-proteobacteria)]|nr:hypothetical protein [Paracoccus sp. (in: a-proteobacteria)]
MQLLAHYTVTDYAAFKSTFDEAAENRGAASLNLLQLWRENATSAWALYSVGDAKRAREYLDGAAGAFNSRAGVTATAFHFVETA